MLWLKSATNRYGSHRMMGYNGVSRNCYSFMAKIPWQNQSDILVNGLGTVMKGMEML